jgi:hypothetical protein
MKTNSQTAGRKKRKSYAKAAENKNTNSVVFFASFAQLLRPLRPAV